MFFYYLSLGPRLHNVFRQMRKRFVYRGKPGDGTRPERYNYELQSVTIQIHYDVRVTVTVFITGHLFTVCATSARHSMFSVLLLFCTLTFSKGTSPPQFCKTLLVAMAMLFCYCCGCVHATHWSDWCTTPSAVSTRCHLHWEQFRSRTYNPASLNICTHLSVCWGAGPL